MKKLLIILLFMAPMVEAHELRVLSWNVFMLPKPIKKSLQVTRSRVIPDQLAESNFDLIFLQEAFMKSFRSKVSSRLRKSHPHSYYLKLPSFPLPLIGSGLYIVSKYPLKILDRVYFKNCINSDCLAAKGAVMVEVTLPRGQKVHLVNTHLQASESAGSIRLKQLGQIQGMLAKNSSQEIPQFLIGDLNIDVNEPEFPLGLSLLGMDYSRLTGPILTTTGRVNPCYKTGNNMEWVDHIWFDNYPGLSASELRVKVFEFERKGLTCPSSDHHAIEGNFYF